MSVFLSRIRTNISVCIWNIIGTQYMMNYHFGYYFKMPSQANVFFFSQIGNGQGNVMDFTAEHFVSKEVHSHMLKGGQ